MKKKVARAVTVAMSGVVAATSVPSAPVVMAGELENGGVEVQNGEDISDPGDGSVGDPTGGDHTGGGDPTGGDSNPTPEFTPSITDIGIIGSTAGSYVTVEGVNYSRDLTVTLSATGLREEVVVSHLEIYAEGPDGNTSLASVDGGEISNVPLGSFEGTLKVKITLVSGEEFVENLSSYVSSVADLGSLVVDTEAPVFGEVSFSGDMDPVSIDGTTYYQEDGVITIPVSDNVSGVDEESLQVTGIGKEFVDLAEGNLTIDTTGLVDGENTITLNISDTLGNVGSTEFRVFMYRGESSIVCSGVVGSVYTDSESGKSYVRSADTAVSVTLSGCSDIWYQSFKLVGDSGDIESFGTESDIKDLKIPVGVSGLRLQVTDVLGEVSEISLSDLTGGKLDNTISVDENLPVIGDVELVDSDTIDDGDNAVAVDIEGYLSIPVEDLDSGISQVRVTRGGVSVPSTFEGGVVRVNLTDLSAGENALVIEVTDNVGNVSTKEYTQWVLLSVPEIRGRSVAGSYEFGNDRIYTRREVRVAVSGVTGWGIAGVYLIGGSSDQQFDESGELYITESGDYSIRVVDLAGRERVYALSDLFELNSGVVEFDLDAPVVSMESFSGEIREGTNGVSYVTGDGTFTFHIGDDGVGVDWGSVEILNGTSPVEFSVDEDTGNVTVESSQFSNSSSVELAVQVSDDLGNQSEDYGYSFSVLRELSTVSGVSHGDVVLREGISFTNKELPVQLNVNSDEISKIELVRDGEVTGEVESTFTISESGTYVIRVTNILGDSADYNLGDLFSDGSISSAIVFDTTAPVFGSREFSGSSKESGGVEYYVSDGEISYSLADDGVGLDSESLRVVGLPAEAYRVADGSVIIDTSYLSEGITEYSLSISDSLGNTDTIEDSVYMYRSAPSVAVESVHGEYYTDNSKGITYFNNTINVYLNVSSSEKVTHLYLVNEEGERVDIESNHFAISETGEYTIEMVTLLGDVVEYSLEDLYEGVYSNMELDTGMPTVSSKSFDGDRETVGDRIYYTSDGTITIEVADFGSGVDAGSWVIRGVDAEYVSVAEDGLSVEISTEGLVDGLTTLSVTVSDMLGNSLTDTTDVYMYRSTPEISGNSHSSVISKNGVSYTTTDVNVSIVGFDNEKVTKVELLKDGTVVGAIEDGSFTISESGNYTIQVTDLLNDVQTYRMENLFSDGFSSEVEFDIESPEITHRSFDGTTRVVDDMLYYTSDGTLTLGVEDAGVGLGSEFFSVSGISAEAVTYEGSNISIDTSYLSEGESTIRVNVVDELGNTREYSIELYMFRTVPTVSGGTVSGGYYTSEDSTYISDDLTFAINTSENAKITSVELYRDGESVSGITNNTFVVSDSGRYSVVLTDILGDKHEYSLNSLFTGVSSNIMVDVDAPSVSSESFTGKSVNIEDQIYYTTDGTYSVRVADAGSGVKVDTWNVSGIDSKYISYSADGCALNIDTAGLLDGDRSITYEVRDNLGNTLTGSINLFMHREFPVVTGGSHSNVLVRDGSIYIKSPFSVQLSGYDSYKVASVEVFKDGERVGDITETGNFSIEDSGRYTFRVTDIIGEAKEYSLGTLFSDLADTVVLDTEAPSLKSKSFTGQSTTVDGVEYYVADGNIVLEFEDLASGVNRDSFRVTGVGEEDIRVSESGTSIEISTVNIPEGSHSLELSVEDNLGNSYSMSIPVFMFRYAPEISGVSHSDVNMLEGTSYINRNLEVSLGGWDNYKIKTIELYRNGTLIDEVKEGKFAVSSSGEYTIRVVDLVNNARVYRLEDLFDSITSDIVVDTETPEAVLEVNGSAIDSSVWVTGEGILTIDLSDEIGLNSAVVTVNGQTIRREFGNATTGTVSVDLQNDIERAENGIYRVVVTVNDTAGNSITTDSQTIRADFDAPTFEGLSADGFIVEDVETGKVYLRGELSVTGSTADIGSGVARVELLNGDTVVTNGLPLAIASSGTYTLRVIDGAGLSSEVSLNSILGTESNDIIVDNAAPSISRISGFTGDLVLNDNIWYGSAPELVYEISDENIRSVSITVNGDTVVDTVSDDGLYTIDTSGYEGAVEVVVEAVDRVGNVSTDSFSYMSDFTAPSGVSGQIDREYISKSGTIFFRDTPSVSVSAKDTGVGIAEYRLSGSRVESNSTGTFELGSGSYSVEVVDRLGHSSGVIPIGELLGMGTNTFVVDGTAPEISASKPNSAYQNWYGEDVPYSITLRDNVGIDTAEVTINGQRVEIYSTTSVNERETVLNVNTSDVPESANGMYEIQVAVVDNAGNRSDWSDVVYVDRTAPTVERFIFTGDGSVEGVESNGSNRYGFFFNGGATCEIRVSDGDVSSGMDKLIVTLEPVNGSASSQTVDISGGVARVSIPSNFKGFISAYAVDRVGHQGAVNQPDGVVTEDSNYHINSLSLDIQLPETQYQDTSGNPLYGADVSATATIGCRMSGIRSIEWGIGNSTLGTVSVGSNGSVTGDSASVTSTDRNLVLSLNKALAMQGNANGLELWVRVVDRTGHTSETSRIFSIDKDAPVISVAYDTTEEDTYYAGNRTATITVKERNFDPSQFRVEGEAGSLGSWSNNGDVWTNTMTFAEDGDYQFTLSCTDRAGNDSAVYSSERFTIDKTAPVMSVSWNDDNPTNGDFYNSTRVATVTVVEHNFDPSSFTLSGDGVLSGWSGSGDTHVATIEFSRDGQYQFSISGEDLAGNASESFESGIFNIDATMPTLEISGVEDSVSYKEDVGFSISMSDANIDMSNTYVSLVGRKNGTIRVDGTLNEQTGEYSFSSFPREEMYDDIYTLTAVVVDRAGNTVEREITFSVNRFGSKYTFMDPSILGTYLREAQDVVITETNVDKLDTNSARVVVIKDGMDYPVDEQYIHIEETEGEDGKYIYTYRVDKEAFSEDGAYLVQIYSHAVEGTDYNSLSQEYAFVLDTTPPEIIVSGVESGETYQDYERTVTIDVRDLSGVQEITVELNGENVPLNRANGVYSFTIQESSEPQSIVVRVVDMAGNESTVTVDNFVLSSESTVYLINQPWFRWGIAAVIAFLAAIMALIVKNRREAKKDEEEASRKYSELYKTSSGSASASGSSTGGKDPVGDLDSTEEATTDVMDNEDKVVDLEKDSEDSNK